MPAESISPQSPQAHRVHKPTEFSRQESPLYPLQSWALFTLLGPDHDSPDDGPFRSVDPLRNRVLSVASTANTTFLLHPNPSQTHDAHARGERPSPRTVTAFGDLLLPRLHQCHHQSESGAVYISRSRKTVTKLKTKAIAVKTTVSTRISRFAVQSFH